MVHPPGSAYHSFNGALATVPGRPTAEIDNFLSLLVLPAACTLDGDPVFNALLDRGEHASIFAIEIEDFSHSTQLL